MSNAPLRTVIERHLDVILKGSFLAIDPASTTFGWAIFKAGEYVSSGAKSYRGGIGIRLHQIFMDVHELATESGADLLAIERLRANTKGKQFTPPQLLWAVGVTIAAAPLPVVEVSPQSHKVVLRRMGWTKSDETDAKCIGLRIIELAKEMV